MSAGPPYVGQDRVERRILFRPNTLALSDRDDQVRNDAAQEEKGRGKQDNCDPRVHRISSLESGRSAVRGHRRVVESTAIHSRETQPFEETNVK